MIIEIEDVNDVKRIAAIKAAVESGFVFKEEKPKEKNSFFSIKANRNHKWVINIDITNASDKQLTRFEHLYARYQLKEKTALNAKSNFLTTIGVGYTLGIIGMVGAIFVGMKQCVPEPEPTFPKTIKKVENKLPVFQNQLTR